MSELPTSWFFDYISPHQMQLSAIKNILYSGKSRFQSVQIIETMNFGRCLILDGKTQSSEADEFIYHEALVQPPMITHPTPQTIFIAGGGEGATLREVLAHPTVKKVVMIDIDREVIDLCREFLPSLHQGSFDDSRLELLHLDARKYLTETEERFDVIIIDLPEPIEGGPAYLLYTREFYEIARRRLTENGLISVQAGSAALGTLLNFTAVHSTLKAVFPVVAPYKANVPSFGSDWGFCLISQNSDPRHLSPEEVDRRISARVSKTLRFYDGLAHQGIFSLPKYFRQELAKENRVITDSEPFFIH